MKLIRASAALGAVAAGLLFTSAASATITFNLQNVTLSSSPSGGVPLGSLTGSFTTDDARTVVTGYNITASAAGSFTGFVYTLATATVSAATLPSQYFQLDSAGALNELRIYFASGLTASGGAISSTFSYEHEPTGGNRFLSGSVVAAAATVPEPATWTMMIGGFGLVGGTMRRRKASISFA